MRVPGRTYRSSKFAGNAEDGLLTLVFAKTEWLAPYDRVARKGGAPITLHVTDHQIGSRKVINSGRPLRIVHRVRHVTHKSDVFSDFYHLPDTKRSAQNAHVEMNPAKNHAVDFLHRKEVVGLLPIVGNGISLFNSDTLDLSRPGFANGDFGSGQLHPMSESSIGNTPSNAGSGQHHLVPHLSFTLSGTGDFANGAR